MTRRKEFALVGAITVLGAALRVYQIGAQSLWFDELLSVTIGRLPLVEVISSPASIDPPLYYVLLHFWLRFSSDDSVLRLLSALPGMATIPAMYMLGKRLFDTQVGFAAAMIFAIAPLQLFYAQEARMYSWLVFFSVLAILAYTHAQGRDTIRAWALWIAMMTLAIYTHTFAGLLLIALDADALLRWRGKSGNRLQPIFLSNFAIGILLVPSFVLLLQKLTWLLPSLWLTPPTILQPLLTLYAFTFGFTLPSPTNIVALFTLLTALAFIVLSIWHVLRHGNTSEQSSIQLLLSVLFLPLVIVFLISQWRSIYIDRLLLEASPALYILLAWGLIRSDRRGVVRVCALAGLPLILFGIFNYYTQADYAKTPLRDAIQFVAAHRAPNEIVIHTSDSSFLAGRYYDALGPHRFLFNPADQWLTPGLMRALHLPFNTDPLQVISGQNRFWVVVAADHIPEEQLAEKAFFDRQGTVLEQNQIGGVGIYYYARISNAVER